MRDRENNGRRVETGEEKEVEWWRDNGGKKELTLVSACREGKSECGGVRGIGHDERDGQCAKGKKG